MEVLARALATSYQGETKAVTDGTCEVRWEMDRGNGIQVIANEERDHML